MLRKVSEMNKSVIEQLRQIEIDNEEFIKSQEGDKVCLLSTTEELGKDLLSLYEKLQKANKVFECELCNKSVVNKERKKDHIS